MKCTLEINSETLTTNLAYPLDISIPLRAGQENVNAWYVNPVTIEPVISEFFIGDVNKGGSVNFRNINFNPHGNGTHTECVGHISKEWQSINQTLKTFFFKARLISLLPEIKENGDRVITLSQLKIAGDLNNATALVIRTLPNTKNKINFHYSNTNPAFLEPGVGVYLREQGIDHLLIDTPSVDREFDEGKLLNHHGFWNYPAEGNNLKTITEMIYVQDSIEDGYYLLNLQIASFENDAAPSKPVLYKLQN